MGSTPFENLYPDAIRQRYPPVRVLGRGGFGLVFLAEDRELRRLVAVKVLDPAALHGLDAPRFARECRVLGQLSHPGVVRLFDAAPQDSRPYIIMEYLEGEPLDERLSRRQFNEAELRSLVAGMLDGLAHVHEMGMLHRDIKPSNVFLRHGREPVLIDFGLARLESPTTLLTEEGLLVGTPRYIAPELLRGAAPSVQTDLFGLGLTAIRALCPASPFGCTDVDREPIHEILSALGSGAYFEIISRELRGQGPLAQLLLKAILPNAADRFESARAMARSVASLPPLPRADPITVRNDLPGGPAPRRRRAPALLAALAVALLAGIALLVGLGARSAAPPEESVPPVRPSVSSSGASTPEGPPPPRDRAALFAQLHRTIGMDVVEPQFRKREPRKGKQEIAAMARALLERSRIGELRPGDLVDLSQGPEQLCLYGDLVVGWHLGQLAASGGFSAPSITPLFPASQGPTTAAPPAGRRFEKVFSPAMALTFDRAVGALEVMGVGSTGVRRRSFDITVSGVARARQAWLGLALERLTPATSIFVSVNDGYPFALLDPSPGRPWPAGSPLRWLGHSVPPGCFREGTNRIKAKVYAIHDDAIAARGISRFEVVLTP